MKIIELKPDSKLLKTTFDGYKLSLESIPILKVENSPRPDAVAAVTSLEYSYLHSSLYQLHNHLVGDPWLGNSAYFLDYLSNIQKISYDINTGRLKPLSAVFRVSFKRPVAGSGGVYNCDFKFISEKYAVLSDGVGGLRILETGDRQKNDEWKSLQVLQPLSGTGFILKDAKFMVEKEEKFIHCLLLNIKQVDGKFFNIVDWVTYKQTAGGRIWEEAGRRAIQGKGNLHYLSLDPRCKSIVYSSNNQYAFTLDTVNEIVEPPKESRIEIPQVSEVENTFKWTQYGKDVTIHFKRTPEAQMDSYDVSCKKNHIEVKLLSEVLLQSDMFAEIDEDLTTWSLENDSFQVKLVKLESEIIWPYLVPGGPPMEASEDHAIVPSGPVLDLTSQIEECDFDDDGGTGEEYFIGN